VRIVSLIASATEMVNALGLGDFQVGRSHECDYPPSVLQLPVCTAPVFDIHGDSREIDQRVKETLATAESVYRVFDETLEQLKPTHIVTQTQCKVCAVSLSDVERALSARFSTRPDVIALEPNSLDEIYKDIIRLAKACHVEERGEHLIAAIKDDMATIVARIPGRNPRVINVEWQEPLMAAGNWIPELTEMLGAENLFGAAGAHSPWMQWDDVIKADPDVIICMPCGYNLKQTRAEMHWHDWTKLRAQVYLADGNQYLNRPGPRVAKSMRIMAEILYPESFEPTLAGIGWEKF
jgi:iron complex transport system substrate-binding protein